ncbi:MAG: hypothetical protein E6Y30_07130 [Finegoldia magna]|nr:hypothetical protein [Finegoldia magna]DAS61987.1 MAG TPA: hypothetical protein [Caudoviricetes sp.]
MGGRGASVGISKQGKKYGTEYKTLFKVSNIKFISMNGKGSQNAPMETMTRGRVYVLVDKNKNILKNAVYFDKKNKRNKQIDLDHLHEGMKPHVHHGYYHSEYEVSKKGGTKLNTKEKKLIKFIDKAWKEWNDRR